MAKSLFLLLIVGVMSVVGNPGWLTATDTVMLTGVDFGHLEAGLNPDGMTETVSVSEFLPESEPVLAPEAGQVLEYVEPANNIRINGRVIALEYTDSTAEDAGEAALAWYHGGGKFIYGHNSGDVFGFLDIAYDGGWLEGMNFSVTMEGVAQNYTVVNYRLYDLVDGYTLGYEGYNYGMAPIMRAELFDVPTHSTLAYQMAIMTCYAGSTQRLVVFAE